MLVNNLMDTNWVHIHIKDEKIHVCINLVLTY